MTAGDSRVTACESSSGEAVAVELISFGHELERSGAAQVGGAFTDEPAADRFVRDDPNAFLIGVLFTQGIPAERAWAGPHALAQRLGSFALPVLADEERVASAVQAHPMLHRFKNTLPAWISSAARRVAEEYGGDARLIWTDGSTVSDVVERLSAFHGIGRKKAVMATEILVRHFGVRLEGRECGTVAYDVHVRRVFLRTGLVERDDRELIEAAASRLCHESPGTLDLPAWLIGRDYCRPKSPRCDECRLSAVCPRLVERNAIGVGARRAERERAASTG